MDFESIIGTKENESYYGQNLEESFLSLEASFRDCDWKNALYHSLNLYFANRPKKKTKDWLWNSIEELAVKTKSIANCSLLPQIVQLRNSSKVSDFKPIACFLRAIYIITMSPSCHVVDWCLDIFSEIDFESSENLAGRVFEVEGKLMESMKVYELAFSVYYLRALHFNPEEALFERPALTAIKRVFKKLAKTAPKHIFNYHSVIKNSLGRSFAVDLQFVHMWCLDTVCVNHFPPANSIITLNTPYGLIEGKFVKSFYHKATKPEKIELSYLAENPELFMKQSSMVSLRMFEKETNMLFPLKIEYYDGDSSTYYDITKKENITFPNVIKLATKFIKNEELLQNCENEPFILEREITRWIPLSMFYYFFSNKEFPITSDATFEALELPNPFNKQELFKDIVDFAPFLDVQVGDRIRRLPTDPFI